MAPQVSVGQVKRDLAELINKVAYGGEWIVITSRGKPKVVLTSMSDFEHLTTQRKARFTVIREIQDAAPDLPFEKVQKEVTDAVNKASGKNAAGRR